MPFPLPAEAARQIKELNVEFMAAFKAQDAQRLAHNTYCKNGQALPTNSPVLHGQAAIAKLFQGAMDMGVKEAVLTPDEAWACDPTPDPHMCMERAAWAFKDKDGNTMDAGKFLTVLIKEDGKYKYLYDMFSSNGPVEQGSK